MTMSVLMVPTLAPGAARSVVFGDLARALDGVLSELPAAPTLVILSTGSEPLVEDVNALALPDRTIPVAGAPELVAAVVERGQVPRVTAGSLGGRPAALAATVHGARQDARFIGVTIAGLADPAALEGAIVALRGALDSTADALLVVPGDVGPAPEAAVERLRGALRTHDLGALAALAAHHPDRAGVLAPIRLALAIAQARGQRFEVHAEVLVEDVLRVVGTAG
jgi:hypothetical protein